ncbi:MAG: DUF3575 domain-containing protein [Bacteroidaceae bacterium]|nr:DUF3575 domain-containing protein [Bacteroidaceae bacterium]
MKYRRNILQNWQKMMTTWLLSLFSVAVFAAPSMRMLSDTDSDKEYSYIYFCDADDSLALSDEEFYNYSGKLVFPINKYDLPMNSAVLRELDTEVIPLINRENLEIVSIMMRGAASPEGPYDFNKFLGGKRAHALLDFVNSRLAVPVDESIFKMNVVYEDYRMLSLLMKKANDQDYETVKALCDKYFPDNLKTLKSQLMAQQGGRLWQRLLKTYFPELRAAGIVFVVRKRPVVVEPIQPKDTLTVQPVVEVPVAVDTVAEDVMLRVPRREWLSVKSNLLFDFAYMPGYDRWCPIPNVAIEYYPKKGHFTWGASIDFPWWQHYWQHKYFQIRNYQLEGRYYFRSGSLRNNPPGKGAAFRGLYVQAYVHGGLFSICFNEDKGWIGEGLGGGVGVGYVLPISKKGHWKLEFSAQFGFFTCKYDPFQYESPLEYEMRDQLYYYKWTLSADLFKKRQYRFNWFGPTRVGISLSYDILYRRRAKKCISLIPWEDVKKDTPLRY